MTNSLSQRTSQKNLSPKEWYLAKQSEPGFFPDPAQDAAIGELDLLWHQLIDFKSKRNQFLGRSLLSPHVPKGLYLWGGVGRGKTFLMDAFYDCLPYRRKRRIHFHNFMAEVHHEMKQLATERDPLIALCDRIEKSTRVLCLDEFHVDDIADAMILGRLISAIFDRGVILITTSNYPPDGLYPNGLQRQNFLPAIALLNRELRILHIESEHDYRLRTAERKALFLVFKDAAEDTENESRLSIWFERISTGIPAHDRFLTIRERRIPVVRQAENAVWFEFSELCGGAHAQEDYLAIAHRYPTVFLSHIPRMNSDHAAAAKRFTWLIDVLYDNNVRLIASAASTPDQLYADGVANGEFARTSSRLSEMQTQAYLQLPHVTQRVTL
jgi:cell division protein ZapE